MDSYFGYMIIAGIFSVIGYGVQQTLRSKFKKYSRVGLRNGLAGYKVAEDMLSYYGIQDVKVVEGRGVLTDHYNPMNKTVSLSPEVYRGASVAAAAVAAHECGHAVQHAKSYPWLQLRSGLVPLVKFSAMAQQWLFIAAFIFLNTIPQIMLITIIAFGVTTLFSLITLPVEFDASKRGLAWLTSTGITQGAEYDGAKDALWWAAMTYVSAALSSLVMLVYLIFRYMGARD